MKRERAQVMGPSLTPATIIVVIVVSIVAMPEMPGPIWFRTIVGTVLMGVLAALAIVLRRRRDG